MEETVPADHVGVGGALTLPGAFCADERVFAAEMERIFLRRWICAGREEQIPFPGDGFARDVGSESALVVRAENGEIRAFHNVCRHRGARICEGPAGHFGGAIRCPYHAWTYGLDGGLRRAPGMEGVAGFEASQHPLLPVGVARWEGFIFLWMDGEPVSFEETHAPILARFARWRMPHLETVQRIDYEVRANWKLIVQNYSECLHCPPVHPSLVRLTPADSGRNDLTEGPFLGGWMELRRAESMTLSGRACAPPIRGLPRKDLRRVYYYALFPNLLLSLHPDYVMVHTLWPVAPGLTRVECAWMFEPDSAARPEFDPDDAVGFWDRTNREDWSVCERAQRGMQSRAFRQGPYSPREVLCAAFDREVLRALGLSSPAEWPSLWGAGPCAGRPHEERDCSR